MLVDLGLLTQSELEATIVTEFNPIRCGFKGGDPLWVNDCLNIGVNPKTLIATLRAKFQALGGVIYEHTEFKSAVVCHDGVAATVVAASHAPAGVGDTNRPNALAQQQRQQQRQRPQQERPGQGVLERIGSGQQQASRQDKPLHNGSSGSTQEAVADGQKKGPRQVSARLLLDCMGELHWQHTLVCILQWHRPS